MKSERTAPSGCKQDFSGMDHASSWIPLPASAERSVHGRALPAAPGKIHAPQQACIRFLPSLPLFPSLPFPGYSLPSLFPSC